MTIEDIIKELPYELTIISSKMTKEGISSKTNFYNKTSIPKEVLRQDIFSIEPVMIREGDNYRAGLAIRYFVDCNENEVKLYSTKNVLKMADCYIEDMLINKVKDNKERDKSCPFYDECEEMHGKKGTADYISCPQYNNCDEPLHSFYEAEETVFQESDAYYEENNIDDEED
jgi:hypothetical protein